MGNTGPNFEELEGKIQVLIDSHSRLKAENEALLKENTALAKSLEAEKARLKWVEDGYGALQDAEKKKKTKTIGQLQRRIEDLISEVDKNISLIDNNNNNE
jgi:predicted nuclease with TOPRIM domain